MFKHSSSTTAPLLFCRCDICKAARAQGYSVHSPTEAPLFHCFCDICMAARVAGYFPMIKKENSMNTKTSTTNSTAKTALKTALILFAAGALFVLMSLVVGVTMAFTYTDLKDVQGPMTAVDLVNTMIPNLFLALFTVLGGFAIGAFVVGAVIGTIFTAIVGWIVAGAMWESFKDWWCKLSDLRQARYTVCVALLSLIVGIAYIVNGEGYSFFGLVRNMHIGVLSLAVTFGSLIYTAATLFTMIDPHDLRDK